MNKILSSVLFGVSLCVSQAAFADQIYTPSQHATMIEKKGNFFKIGSWRDKKLDAGRWQLSEFGSNVTSGERLQNLAKYQLALIAIDKGYTYFDFTPTRKSLTCVNIISGDPMINPTVDVTSNFSTKPQAGMESAKTFINENSAMLSHDASDDEKQAVFSDWQATCYQMHPAKGLARAKMVKGVVNILVSGLLLGH